MKFKTYYHAPIGRLLLASDGKHLTGLWKEKQKYFAAGLSADSVQKDDLEIFSAAKSWLDRYFAGEKLEISELPIKPAGTPFQEKVWEILCRIPYGNTVTYGDIAREMAELLGRKSMSAQAVGGTVGRNPISIIIPCHRVVGAGGSLTGYAGGIDVKVKLLELEGADLRR